MQAAQDFESRKNAVDAIELAAVRLRIQVAAGNDRRKFVIASVAARKNIAHVVDFDTATDFLTPADKQVADLAVFIGQRQAA